MRNVTSEELAPDLQAIVESLGNGDLRLLGRLLTRVESKDPDVVPLLGALYRRGGDARVIGVTGPPGAGKSTLVNQLVAFWRRQGLTVAVLAVDPSSPFSGGAILGDRLRMLGHSADEGVFVRSMAAREQLGGLASATADALTVLDAMHWDRIVIETVGVGQNETDIMRLASVVLLLQTPMGGDDVQAVKAGVMEIADIFVVNKGDLPGSDQTVRVIEQMVDVEQQLHPEASWRRPVVKVHSLTGDGVEALDGQIARRFTDFAASPEAARARQQARIRHQVVALVRAIAERRLFGAHDSAMEELIAEVMMRKSDPYALATRLLAQE